MYDLFLMKILEGWTGTAWYDSIRCGTVQIVPKCLPDCLLYYLPHVYFTIALHNITTIIFHNQTYHVMSNDACDDYVMVM